MSRVLPLIAVGLIAIGAFAWWMMPCNTSKARWVKAQTDMAEMLKVLMAYKGNHGSWPPAPDLVADSYSGRLPLDPFSMQPYQYTVTGDSFRLVCLGKDQAEGGDDIPDRDIIFTQEGLVKD